MIVKKSQSIPRHYLYNAAGVVFAVSTLALMMRSTLHREEAVACSERATVAIPFDLERSDGSLLGAQDIQARLAGNDWGLLDNVEVRALTDGPANVAIKVALPSGAMEGGTLHKAGSGAGFTWISSQFTAGSTACLRYNLFLSDNFSFDEAGFLPGIFAEYPSKTKEDGAVARLNLPLRWFADGRIGFQVQDDMSRERPKNLVADYSGLRLKPGHWMAIDQEVIMNSPGQSDGKYRLWIDGQLRYEIRDARFYAGDEAPLVQGVVANMHYASTGTEWRAAPRNTGLAITPFVLHR